ncbi:hypothetical protein GOBAR_AA07361 [Gossypium barbadense]|uniref:Uncharacterized protein n=1 Tax=Gossypium barbadense TaxID=3634 RepID=A0A2P5YCK8_GOSBA|nr:hypothetical protein GOBAR_AA07361 [Gossypium barbadense]
MGFWGLSFGEGRWHLMVVERGEGGKCRRVEEGSRWEGAAKDCIFCSSQVGCLNEGFWGGDKGTLPKSASISNNVHASELNSLRIEFILGSSQIDLGL